MAIVNKSFKLKHGLVVEGTTATVNGNQVLTEEASDQYILDLIGGESLITSVSNEFDTVGGELLLDRTVVDNYYDAAGSAENVALDLSTHENLTSGVHGVIGDLVSTIDPTFSGTLTLDGPGAFTISSDNDIIIDATGEGGVYIGLAAAGNKVATEQYVDSYLGTSAIATEAEAPLNPIDGQIYFNTNTSHLYLYSSDSSSWVVIANFEDTEILQQHIHDISIDGTGLIVSVFQDAGFYDSVSLTTVDAGSYSTVAFDQTFDGGNPTDNLN